MMLMWRRRVCGRGGTGLVLGRTGMKGFFILGISRIFLDFGFFSYLVHNYQ